MIIPGGPELAICFLVALLVFGPRRLPEIARFLGKATKAVQEATREVKEQIDLAALDAPSPKRPSYNYTPPEISETSENSSYTSEADPYANPEGEDIYASTFEDSTTEGERQSEEPEDQFNPEQDDYPSGNEIEDAETVEDTADDPPDETEQDRAREKKNVALDTTLTDDYVTD